jgi:hypothetical protein
VWGSKPATPDTFEQLNGAACARTLAGPPHAPALALGPIGATTVQVKFTDRADNEDGFQMYRCDATGNACVLLQTWPELPVHGYVRTYDDTGLSPATPYVYRVRAYNDLGFKEAELAATTAP